MDHQPQRRSARLLARAKRAQDQEPVHEAAPPAKRRRRSSGGHEQQPAASSDQPQPQQQAPLQQHAPAPGDAADAPRRQPKDQPRAAKRAGGDGGSSKAKRTAAGAGSSKAKPKARGGGGSTAGGPSRAAEQALWARGFKAVAGVDEAGRGPLAGPVVAAAAVLPADAVFPGLQDSKQMTEAAREELYEQLTSHPGVRWGVSVVGRDVIDDINILQAAMLAMRRAVEALPAPPDHLLIDGNRKPCGLGELPAQLIVKGDASSTCIAAASVIAKVTRDRLMQELDAAYPQYGFAQHKGYGVPAHKAAIKQHGPCAEHRRSFEPVKSMTGWAGYGKQQQQQQQVASHGAAALAAA